MIWLTFWLKLRSLIFKLEDKGAILYSQERVGQGGKVFRLYKFRSMVPDAENSTGPVWASENDHRVTRVGRVLRATAMDELPQLWNILKGDMSFVGPRPERPGLVEKFCQRIPHYDIRHQIRPGLTGLAQVFGKYDTPPEHKLRYDLVYLKTHDFWLDIRLLSLSFIITFRGKWESRMRKF